MAPGAVPLAADEPKLLYHYTDPAGLYGIVENKNLRASDVWFMNDAREAIYGLDTVEQALQPRNEPARDAEVRRRALDWIKNVRMGEEFLRSYIACLSADGDDLSQWRAYGRPRGFSIGFDTAQLRSLCSPSPKLNEPTLRYVMYDGRKQEELISFQFNQAVYGLPVRPTDEQLQAAAANFAYEVFVLAPAMKHHSFSSEQEARLHVYRQADDTGGLDFRPGAMGLVPFVPIDLRNPETGEMTLVREVIIGPQSNERESQLSVKQFFAHHGMGDVKVLLSKVPLR